MTDRACVSDLEAVSKTVCPTNRISKHQPMFQWEQIVVEPLPMFVWDHRELQPGQFHVAQVHGFFIGSFPQVVLMQPFTLFWLPSQGLVRQPCNFQGHLFLGEVGGSMN